MQLLDEEINRMVLENAALEAKLKMLVGDNSNSSGADSFKSMQVGP